MKLRAELPGRPRNTTTPPALLTSAIIAFSDAAGIDRLANATSRGASSGAICLEDAATIASKSNVNVGSPEALVALA